jgi:hypothetical protein
MDTSTRTFIGVPGAKVGNTTVNCVWGGHPVRDSASSEWHWFGSVIRDGKPLSGWATSSLAAHAAPATANKSISGPYRLDSIVLAPESGADKWDDASVHGVYPMANPSPMADGRDAFLIFFTGISSKNPLQSRQIGVAYAASLAAKAWTRYPAPVFSANSANASAVDSSSVSNPAPAFGPNNTLLMAYKGNVGPNILNYQDHTIISPGSIINCFVT